MYHFTKRLLDVAGATVLLVVTAPIQLFAAVCILLEDGRPVLFSQARCGKNGETFTIWKLRSLSVDPQSNGSIKSQSTRTGQWLRRFAVDELPQLWNILKGDMSLVGPRPTLPEQVERYGAFEKKRLQVRPGLTGWAQVNGRNALPWPKRIELDVWYVENQSLWLDLRILLKTPFALFRNAETYGPSGENFDFTASEQANTPPKASKSHPSAK